LLVDVSAIIRHDAQTGIQRVVRAVWSELAKRSGNGFIALPVFATSRHGYRYAPADFLDSGRSFPNPEPAALTRGDIFLGLDLSAHLLPKYREQLRAWRQEGASVNIVVYDLLPLERPEWFTAAAAGHFKNWMKVLRNDVDVAVCISDYVADQLAKHIGIRSPPRLGRLAMGADMSASRPSRGLSDKVRKTLDEVRRRPSVLMVGTIEPRKGYEAALDAFDLLWDEEGDAPLLVIVGKRGWKSSALQHRLATHRERDKRLIWLECVSDEGLGLLYDSAAGVLVTSRAEGFGLPLVEAASHRRNVLARDLAVFREQRLPNIAYFEGDEPVTLSSKVKELAARGSSRPAPADLTSWRESVNQLLVDLGIQSRATYSSGQVRRSA
jgi:glycosyltransferase involved in cell wall biosynthesis